MCVDVETLNAALILEEFLMIRQPTFPSRGHSFSTYTPKGVGGSSAMHVAMYCYLSDVIIAAYRVGGWI